MMSKAGVLERKAAKTIANTMVMVLGISKDILIHSSPNPDEV